MRLEELIIDGFKSYATRTVISGWDEQFNCITGLNGSGKSNILDAICFVLGITTMSTVRAQNLQDLIYKRGQAGVTKASVTIVFDNSDTTKSPIGFENCPQISVTRQIVLGGTSKYLINGHRAQQQNVQQLFQSIQLNINNPNFLIMQGRITKVLNMKSTEILAMIEEASGTRMFEERRDKALTTMAKKDKKIEEISDLLREEIEPKLDKLRTEKRSFLEFQQVQSDLERLTRVVVAHDYIKYSDLSANFEQLLAAKNADVDAHEAKTEKTKHEVGLIQQDIDRIMELREKELNKGKKMQKLEQAMKELSHDIVRMTTHIELKAKNIIEEEERGQTIQSNIVDLNQQIAFKQKEFEVAQAQYEATSKAHEALMKEVSTKEELIETLRTGVTSKEGSKNSFMDQLESAKSRASEAKTQQEQLALKVTHLQRRIVELDARADKARKQNQGRATELQKIKGECAVFEQQLITLKFDPEAYDNMKQQEASCESNVRELSHKIDGLKRQVVNVDFSYSDPTPSFDRSKVKGLVAQLFSIEPNKFEAATALEVCAGGKLYNVVVDNEITGSQLLEKGNLTKRVTIIPLNKISAFKASAEKIGAAKSVAPGKVNLALSLVGYDEEVSRAMEFVFGSTLVCADADTAKNVTFDPRIRMKSVTLQGDMYDPNGTLSGGSAPTSSGILVTIQELNKLCAELKQEADKLEQIHSVLTTEMARIEKGMAITQQLDLKKHAALLIEQEIAGSSSSLVINELENATQSVEKLHAEISQARDAEAAARADAQKIERDIAEFASNKGSKLEQLSAEAATLRKKLDVESRKLKTAQKQFQGAQLDKDQLETDIAQAQQSFEEAKQSWNDLNSEIVKLKEDQEATKQRYTELSKVVNAEKEKLIGYDEELSALQDTMRTKNQQIENLELALQKLGHELDKIKSDGRNCRERLSDLMKQYSWVEEERESFGRANSPYDFSAYKIDECKATMKRLDDRSSEMRKAVNGKVMNMIDNVEKKEASLKAMLKTIEKDKRKINETIVSLDEYKKEALIKTWRKVDKDFGQIFSEMLPGSFAKLVAPENKEVTDGLEVKVCLGKIWKESLAELSGGQRSLVALSLIMALLQFKPAPMYILDEVDAALDLSHTQNIGRLIKTRFKGSQFIVVSLKDGLFSNANRVFRTRFHEGTSMVTVM
ncbi:RecF/RecN/SMC [Limtongia smithiae]|uniref:RecF/RecN/SMC n=1 Tax=Limtongia smithiae TaxID=1125753 RepID=UPI0034CD149B